MAFTRTQLVAIQKALNGWWEVTPKLKTDGAWGANTSRGVRQFQKRAGLPETGQLDAATLARLGVQATNASGNPNSGFFAWSAAARKASDELAAYVSSISPLSPNYQPLKQQAAALQQIAQQTDARVQQTANAGATPDPALLAQITQLQTAVAELTGNSPKPATDYSKYLVYGGAALLLVLFMGRD